MNKDRVKQFGPLACTSFGDGFGGSIHLGRSSMGTRGEILGETLH
ncbi:MULTISPECIES: hypothetical protein [Olivibacter]|uniref:Uncharacterized protein n=1 Tax=Olivibacter oleidegradans TaxID=760123 RepID=A0ABV6HM14_9SPHI|nr:hypothetical protein [Olivibacter jilunii]